MVLSPVTLNNFLFSNSKIQKYSPTESAKVYDKTVNRKSNVHFHPRQTIDFIANNMAHATLTHDVKRRIVKQYLDVSNDAVADCMSAFKYTQQEKYTIISTKLRHMRHWLNACVEMCIMTAALHHLSEEHGTQHLLVYSSYYVA